MWDTKKSQNGILTPTKSGAQTFMSYETNNDKSYNFDGFGSHTRVVDDYQLDISEMKIMMPTLNMETPWFSIPRTHLYKESYEGLESIVMWKKIVPTDLCLFVPRLTTDVDAVHYPKGDSLMEESPSSDAEQKIFSFQIRFLELGALMIP